MVTRLEPRIVDQRLEPRHEGLVDCATLFFRGSVHLVTVINISSRGAMVESELEPRLGENVVVRFNGCSPIHAFVRWIREGKLGLNFGCEMTIG
jgi:hypothetical protein